MTAPLTVRLFWLGLAMVAVVAVLLRLIPVTTPSGVAEAEPLNLPQISAAEARATQYGESGVVIGERNPFDQSGERWTPQAVVVERPATEARRRGAPQGIRGLFKVPGVEGVLTDDGFVSVGGTVDGAQVERVDADEVMFSLDRDATATWVNTERNRRREAFEKRGLNLNAEKDRTP